jgi:hypothetical protein
MSVAPAEIGEGVFLGDEFVDLVLEAVEGFGRVPDVHGGSEELGEL